MGGEEARQAEKQGIQFVTMADDNIEQDHYEAQMEAVAGRAAMVFGTPLHDDIISLLFEVGRLRRELADADAEVNRLRAVNADLALRLVNRPDAEISALASALQDQVDELAEAKAALQRVADLADHHARETRFSLVATEIRKALAGVSGLADLGG